jgi:serine/threonine-protein kinase
VTSSPLQQVSDGGGTLKPLTHFEKNETSHLWPEVLPGGKAVLFVAGAAGTADWNKATIAVQSLETGERRNLIEGGTQPHYAPSGHSVFAREGTLMAVPFDLQRLVVTGAAVPVLEGVRQATSTGAAQYSISATGSLIYMGGGPQGAPNKLVWVSRDGAELSLNMPVRQYGYPMLSPDGRQVALDIVESDDHVWLYDLGREMLTPRFAGRQDYFGVWTPDGKRITFMSNFRKLAGC